MALATPGAEGLFRLLATERFKFLRRLGDADLEGHRQGLAALEPRRTGHQAHKVSFFDITQFNRPATSTVEFGIGRHLKERTGQHQITFVQIFERPDDYARSAKGLHGRIDHLDAGDHKAESPAWTRVEFHQVAGEQILQRRAVTVVIANQNLLSQLQPLPFQHQVVVTHILDEAVYADLLVGTGCRLPVIRWQRQLSLTLQHRHLDGHRIRLAEARRAGNHAHKIASLDIRERHRLFFGILELSLRVQLCLGTVEFHVRIIAVRSGDTH